MEYLGTIGCKTFDLTKDTVKDLLVRTKDPVARELLQIRQQASATSPAKYKALIGAVCSDGRLRGTIQFCGAARTGRDAGRIFQPQNLPRPNMSAEAIEVAIEAMKLDCEDLLYNNVSEVCVNAVRGCLVAAPGHKLAVADLSNIEGRVVAWLAGEAWKIKAFGDYDRGTGHDIYVLSYARAFNVAPEVVLDNKKNGDGSMRQIGKTMELACFGPDTLVLTNGGVKAITDVLPFDKLWDGVTWVTHKGLVPRGRKKTLRMLGLDITPDHQILCGETWLSAQMVASCQTCLDLALATGAENSPWLVSTLGHKAASEKSLSNVPAERPSTVSTSETGGAGLRPGAGCAPPEPALKAASCGRDTTRFVPMPNTGDACATVYPHASIAATTRTIKPSATTVGEGSSCTSLGEPTDALSLDTSCPFPGGTSPSLNSTVSTSTGGMNPETCASSPHEQTGATSGRSLISSNVSWSWSDTYDIAHAGPRNRFMILTPQGDPLIVHNCGYQGGLGAFVTMGGTIAAELGDDAINDIVRAWRKAHPAIRSFWYDLERAAKEVLKHPGDGVVVRDLVLDVQTDAWDVRWLRIKLPGGRYLCYMRPTIDEHKCETCEGRGNVLVGGTMEDPGEPRREVCPACKGVGTWGSGAIQYEGINQYTRQWATLDTYGGKLTENVVQAISRDVLMYGLRAAEKAGYAVVLRVHDELVTEVPDTPEFNEKHLASLMATNPPWAAGLPLAAAGFEGYRYRKD